MRKMYASIMVSAGVWLLGSLSYASGEMERASFGNGPSRNMVSDAKGLPARWDSDTGLNVKWVADLGSQTYGGPVVAGGKIFVATNNGSGEPWVHPSLEGDRGSVMAFDSRNGNLLWQSAHPKLASGRVNDWPLQGVGSTPFVEGDRVYYVSNRAEVVCADAEGFRDGSNDGPYTGETETSEIDEDVLWKYDMIGELGVFPHNLAAGSPLIVGEILFTVTGQGVGEDHVTLPSPEAPSFLALNKKTGKPVWHSSLPGKNVLHGSWSNPSYGVIAAKPQVLFPGGDGWLYAFEPRTGELIWKFDLNPEGSRWEPGGRGTKNNVISTPVIHEDKVYISVGQDPEYGEGPGHLWVIDATGTGDVTRTAVVWHVGGDAFHRTLSSASIADGLLYIADLTGFVYCFDANTGQLHWKYDAFAAIWGSTLVADGKVYIGDEDGDVAVLRAGKKMELIHEANMGAAVYTTPAARDGVLYVASRTKLFALEDAIPAPQPEQPEQPQPPPGALPGT